MMNKSIRTLALVAIACSFGFFSGCSCDADPLDAVCGDGEVQDGEQCDDGNNDDGDSCDSDCTTPSDSECGNGEIEGDEQCDDGNTEGGDGCSANCETEGEGPVCGDGVVEGDEQCDDGNAIIYDGCEPDCTPSPDEVDCNELAPLGSGTCEVTAGSAAKLISGDVLLTHTILRGGQVLIGSDGILECVGCDCSDVGAGATAIVCPQAVVSPGLINSHDHITFTQNAPYTDTGERYEHRHDWRRGLNGHTEIDSSGGASDNQIRWGELRFLVGGATSTLGNRRAPGFLRNLDREDQEGLGAKPVEYDTFPLGDSNGTQLASGCGYPDIIPQSVIANEDAYFPHIAEGIDAFARNEFNCTATASNGGEDLLEPQSAYIHAVGLNPFDYARMEEQGTSLIWSPRSNITLYGDTAVVSAAHRIGVSIALGTDWMPTGSMSMLRELACADSWNQSYLDGHFTDRELWQMATVNGARAASMEDKIGALAEGLVGDVTIFDASTNADHRAIVAGEPSDVALVLRGGEALYGDDAVVAALADGCDTVDVCTVQKRLCVQSEIGTSFADFSSQMSSLYPLFFCDTPDNEPSCVPTRPAGVNGSTVYTGAATGDDGDGDGIPDASDNCATVFNPIRPVDNGVQADFDNDGEGDPCDVCPLDADTTDCTGYNADDLDADGLLNAEDNCPETPNPDQDDSDSDGKGDACDACPDTPNPDDKACPATIYEVKTGAVSGTVAIENALVTACGDSVGVFLQMKDGDEGYAGVENSGVFVYQPSVTCGSTLSVGDRVTLNPASISNFFGQIQLNNATIEVIASANETLPEPVPLTAVAAGGDMPGVYESVLVTVQNVLVTDDAPAPGPGDGEPTGEFVVADTLRINDLLYAITPIPAVGTNYISITGVLNYRNGASKLEPRNADDVEEGPPTLVGFGPAQAFTRVGDSNTTTIPDSAKLLVTLSKAAEGDTVVSIDSGDATSLTVVNDGVTVADGQTTAEVLVNGLQQAASVTLTAQLDGNSLQADVRVLADDEVPSAVSLSPSGTKIPPLATLEMTVALDFPAQAGTGNTVSLMTSPGTSGTVPASLTVSADELEAVFNFSATAMLGTETVTATLGSTAQATIDVAPGSGLVINEVDYDQPGGDTDEFVEIFNTTASDVDLSDLRLVLVNGANDEEYDRIDLSAAGTLGSGEYLVVGSDTLLATITANKEIAFNNAVQNGAPDAVGLFDVNTGELIDALSYEGEVTDGTVMGLVGPGANGGFNFVEGTALPSATADSGASDGSLSRVPNGQDLDDAASDWTFMASTPGAANE